MILHATLTNNVFHLTTLVYAKMDGQDQLVTSAPTVCHDNTHKYTNFILCHANKRPFIECVVVRQYSNYPHKKTPSLKMFLLFTLIWYYVGTTAPGPSVSVTSTANSGSLSGRERTTLVYAVVAVVGGFLIIMTVVTLIIVTLFVVHKRNNKGINYCGISWMHMCNLMQCRCVFLTSESAWAFVCCVVSQLGII